jgi:hypothetical protein
MRYLNFGLAYVRINVSAALEYRAAFVARQVACC